MNRNGSDLLCNRILNYCTILAHINYSLSVSPVQDSFHIVVKYLGLEVLRREVLGNDVRIAYLPPSPVPPTLASLMGGFPRISLPEPLPTMASSPEVKLQFWALSTLLPYMEKGVVLTSAASGVYACRYCRGRVFWIGSHTATPGLHKMERNAEPELLFSKEAFRQRKSQLVDFD